MQQWFNASLQRKISGLLVVLQSFMFVVILYSIHKLKLIDAEMHQVAEIDVPLTEMVSEFVSLYRDDRFILAHTRYLEQEDASQLSRLISHYADQE